MAHWMVAMGKRFPGDKGLLRITGSPAHSATCNDLPARLGSRVPHDHPNKLVATINQERMPVLLTREEEFQTWLQGSAKEAWNLQGNTRLGRCVSCRRASRNRTCSALRRDLASQVGSSARRWWRLSAAELDCFQHFGVRHGGCVARPVGLAALVAALAAASRPQA